MRRVLFGLEGQPKGSVDDCQRAKNNYIEKMSVYETWIPFSLSI